MWTFKAVIFLITITFAFVESHARILDCASQHDLSYADENDCTKFYMCTMGQVRLEQCPEGEFYDVQRKSCQPGSCHNDSDEIAVAAVAEYEIKQISEQPKLETGCGSLPQGSVWQTAGSAGNAYQQCLNGSAIDMTCPANLIFNSQANHCMNPCSAISGDGNVMDPNNNSSYYTCKADVIDSIDPTPCPPGQSFFQALVGIDEYFVEYPAAEPANYADGCIASSIIDTCPPGNSFANVPVYPLDVLTDTTQCSNPGPTALPVTNFYVECYQGQGSLQKCPPGYILYEGSCLSAGACPTPGGVSCIC